ncbi:MAG: hypothetical protein ACRC5F_06195 [Cetobacterium sp.]
MNTKKGSTYIETLITITIIIVVLNPLFSSLILIKKNFNRIKDLEELENEIVKIRSFYKKNEEGYMSSNNNYELEIETIDKYESMEILKILIKINNQKRETTIYVYKQK